MSDLVAIARKSLVPTEHWEQTQLFVWCEHNLIRYPDLRWLFAIPNFTGHMGGQKARLIQGAKLKREGRKAGYPDLGLDVARGGYFGWRGELKRQKDGQVRAHQKPWHDRLRAQGYYVAVAKGWEAMRDELIAYLALPPTPFVR